MTDISVKRTLRVAFLYSFYLTLYKTDTSLRWTPSAGPKGVHLRVDCTCLDKSGGVHNDVIKKHTWSVVFVAILVIKKCFWWREQGTLKQFGLEV